VHAVDPDAWVSVAAPPCLSGLTLSVPPGTHVSQVDYDTETCAVAVADDTGVLVMIERSSDHDLDSTIEAQRNTWHSTLLHEERFPDGWVAQFEGVTYAHRDDIAITCWKAPGDPVRVARFCREARVTPR
jgi:hypothetical protein